MNNIRQHIKKVLVEEKGDNKIDLVKSLIYGMFDEVKIPNNLKYVCDKLDEYYN